MQNTFIISQNRY
uniref:Uncharacterized protein n=1 Tax=Arundo donax TaxID=35708 RepID=A0A0A8Y9U1_ARUDO